MATFNLGDYKQVLDTLVTSTYQLEFLLLGIKRDIQSVDVFLIL